MYDATMHVPVFRGDGVLRYEERPRPVLHDDSDVLVGIEACGICGTDLNILAVPPAHTATPGIVIGHEGVGRVVQIGGAIDSVQVGDRVVIAPRICCGTCIYCRSGLENQCLNYSTIGTTREGAFAPFLLAPGSALYRIDPGVPLEDALLFEPLSCVVGAVARTRFRPGDSVAIIGAGPMGLLFALLFRAGGASTVIVVDISEARLAIASRLGVDMTLQASAPQAGAPQTGAEEIAHRIQTRLGGIGADIVVDAVGNQLEQALTLVRRGGQMVLFGLRPHDRQQIAQYRLTRYDIEALGVFVGLRPFTQTIRLLESGRLHPSRLITHRLPLDRLHEGVELMRSGTAMKVMIEIPAQ